MSATRSAPKAAEPARLYNALAPIYDTSFSRPVDIAENTCVRDWLEPHVWFSSAVLDLGCGTGLFLDLFPEFVAAHRMYLGIDISGGMLSRARAKHPNARFRLDDMLSPYAYGYDLVVSLFGAPSYVPLNAFLQRAADALLPRGRLFAIFLGYPYLRRQHYNSLMWTPTTQLELGAALSVPAVWRWARIRPLNILGERLSGWPAASLWLHPFLHLESRLAQKFNLHHRAGFLVLEAQRR